MRKVVEEKASKIRKLAEEKATKLRCLADEKVRRTYLLVLFCPFLAPFIVTCTLSPCLRRSLLQCLL